MFNKTICQMNLTKDAELRYIQKSDSSTPVLNFDGASNEKYGDKEYTTYYSCAIYGKRAEALEKYLLKGTPVIVSGKVAADAYINKENKPVGVLRLTVDTVDFCGGSRKEQSAGDGNAAEGGDSFMNIPEGIDEALPFR